MVKIAKIFCIPIMIMYYAIFVPLAMIAWFFDDDCKIYELKRKSRDKMPKE